MKLKQNKQSKLVVALSAVILLLVALSATLTFAYFTDKVDNSTANVTFGHLEFKTGETITAKTVANVVPGDTVDIASGTAILQHNIDAFYRVGVTIALTKNNNTVTNLNSEIDTIKSKVLSALGIALGESNANVEGDYAYGFAKAGDSTLSTGTKVLDATNAKVTFEAAKYGNEWQDVKIAITINIQAIQAKNVGTGITLPAASGALSEDIVKKIAPATEADTDAMYKIWTSASGVV